MSHSIALDGEISAGYQYECQPAQEEFNTVLA